MQKFDIWNMENQAIFPPEIQNKIFLSSAGVNPGITSWDSVQNESKKIEQTSFSPVYDIDFDFNAMKIATGNKNGIIHIYNLERRNEDDNWLPETTLIQGARVVSVCWISKNLLAASDMAGRLFFWKVNPHSSFISIKNNHQIITSLISKDNFLMGLSNCGCLYFWDIDTNEKKLKIKTPPLLANYDLAKIIYWPTQNTIVFPAKGGLLCMLNLKDRELKTLKAHPGDFCATSIWQNELLTFGLEDQTIKIWDRVSIKEKQSFQTNINIISAAPIPNKNNSILVISSQGVACELNIGSEPPQPISILSGHKYMTCSVPSTDKIDEFIARKKQIKAGEITKKIFQADRYCTDSEIETYSDHLSNLGYQHLSLGLQVDQAIAEGNLTKAIEICHQLVNIIPIDDPNAYSSIKKYAELLEKSFNLVELCNFSTKILKVTPSNLYILETITRCNLDKFNANSWIIEPAIPLENVIESVLKIGTNLCGRFVINTIGNLVSEGIQLNSEKIIGTLINHHTETNHYTLPKLSSEQVVWYSKNGQENFQIIAFDNENDLEFHNLQFVVKVVSSHSDTILTPSVVFDYRSAETESGKKNKSDPLSIFNSIRNNPLSNVYLNNIFQLLKITLQKIITKEKSMGRLV